MEWPPIIANDIILFRVGKLDAPPYWLFGHVQLVTDERIVIKAISGDDEGTNLSIEINMVMAVARERDIYEFSKMAYQKLLLYYNDADDARYASECERMDEANQVIQQIQEAFTVRGVKPSAVDSGSSRR